MTRFVVRNRSFLRRDRKRLTTKQNERVFMTNVFLETDTRGFMGRYSRPGKAVWLRSPQTLVEAVEMAVDQVDTNCLGAVASAQAGTAFQPRTLLGLLTFCYARQIYSSSEITGRMRLELR